MTEQRTTEPGPRFSWLTTEVLLYGAILILALSLRLALLDLRIMDVPEAQNALYAWELAHGGRPARASSPLLLTGQAFLFALFGAGDAAARLLPALAGSAMVLCPYLLRKQLGRWSGLGAALALAISPTLVYVAREGSGVGLLIPSLLGLVTLWLAYVDLTRQPAAAPVIDEQGRTLAPQAKQSPTNIAGDRFVIASEAKQSPTNIAGDRFVIASEAKQSPTNIAGDRFVAPLLAMTDTEAVVANKAKWSMTAIPFAIAILGAFVLLSDMRIVGVLLVLASAWAIEWFFLHRDLIAAAAPGPWSRVASVLGIVLLLVSTALTLNPGGLAAWAEFPGAWFEHLAPVLNGQPWHYPLSALLLYEPFLLVLGALGAIDLIAHRSQGTVLVWLALGALLLALLVGGRNAGDVALVSAFLAFPAGRALGNLIENWRREGYLAREGLYTLAAFAVIVFIALQSSFYAFALYRQLEQADRFLWFWLLAVALIVIMVGLAWAWHGAEVTWRVGGAVVALVLLLSSFSAAVSLNFYHPNDPRELHVRVASDEGLRMALQVLQDVSYHMVGSPTTAPLTVQAGLGPVWSWYLRDWEEMVVVESLSTNITTPLVLSLADQPRLALGNRYIGHDFVARSWWQPEQLVTNDQMSWWLYRKTVVKPEPLQKVVLWMQVQEQLADVN